MKNLSTLEEWLNEGIADFMDMKTGVIYHTQRPNPLSLGMEHINVTFPDGGAGIMPVKKVDGKWRIDLEKVKES